MPTPAELKCYEISFQSDLKGSPVNGQGSRPLRIPTPPLLPHDWSWVQVRKQLQSQESDSESIEIISLFSADLNENVEPSDKIALPRQSSEPFLSGLAATGLTKLNSESSFQTRRRITLLKSQLQEISNSPELGGSFIRMEKVSSRSSLSSLRNIEFEPLDISVAQIEPKFLLQSKKCDDQQNFRDKIVPDDIDDEILTHQLFPEGIFPSTRSAESDQGSLPGSFIDRFELDEEIPTPKVEEIPPLECSVSSDTISTFLNEYEHKLGNVFGRTSPDGRSNSW